ncbi:hypothetical protein QJS04_geneDACA010123 [Acorus gramineus]|uniref:Uncharacterized protein n=1 Tax=Acorus gramineus TaxID=55184 RepID=A0AAV9BG83_ACOGR|nr:hypothetical protein QJS04_geneDACA010123 [Acorus gramineus]
MEHQRVKLQLHIIKLYKSNPPLQKHRRPRYNIYNKNKDHHHHNHGFLLLSHCTPASGLNVLSCLTHSLIHCNRHSDRFMMFDGGS